MLLVERVHSRGIRVANEANTWWGDTFPFKPCSRILHHIALKCIASNPVFKEASISPKWINVARKSILRIDALEIIVFSLLTNLMDSSYSVIPIAVEAVLLPLLIIIYHPGTFSCPSEASLCSSTLQASPERGNPPLLPKPSSEVPSLNSSQVPSRRLFLLPSFLRHPLELSHLTVALPILNGSRLCACLCASQT